MTFKKINESEVVSSLGYKVKYGRDSLTYSEDSKYIIISIEHLGSPYEMEVYLSSVDNWISRGKPSGTITPEEMDELIKRISDSLNFLERVFSIK